MDKYFWMQGKRLCRSMPGALLAAVILLGSLLGIFSLMVRQDAAGAQKQKLRVALVGYTENEYLQMGLTVMSQYDSARFSLEIQQMEPEQAKRALARGEIAAYVEVPAEFMDQAMQGNIVPLKFVTTTGAVGLVSIFKDELTGVISEVLFSAQKGVFGVESAVRDNGLLLGDTLNVMSIRYAEYVFARDKTYSLEELGIGDKLGLEGYLLCGLGVLFLLLCCLPYAPLLIRRDLSLQRVLCAGGRPALMQALAEYGAYCLTLFGMVLVLLLGAEVFAGSDFPFFAVLLRVIPVVLMAAALSYMLCCLATDLIGGMVLQFFSMLALCFVSGCIYPVYVFPVGVQQVAAWLPAGIARSLLAGCITGESAGLLPVYLLAYAAVFFLIGSLVNARRIKGVGQ